MRALQRRSALVAAAVLAVSAAALSGDSSARVALKVLVPQANAALPFLLMEKDNTVPGASLTVSQFLAHAQALAILLRGEADLLVTGTSQGWENRLGGSPIVIVDTGIWGVSSLVGRDPSIRSSADLKGKKIALPFPGSPLDLQTRSILARENIDPDRDLTISYGPFPQSIARLVAGQIDAAALPEPLATTAVREKGLLRLFAYADAWARATGGDRMSPQVSLFATESFLRSHAALMPPLIEAWRKASAAVEADPAATASRFASAMSSDPAVLEEAVRNTLFAVPSPEENRTRVLAYYKDITRWLPGENRPLDEGFFYSPR
jgi:ABC-type nitrate/sulfonate/bicarbonate transport system substrate-binding protein